MCFVLPMLFVSCYVTSVFRLGSGAVVAPWAEGPAKGEDPRPTLVTHEPTHNSYMHAFLHNVYDVLLSKVNVLHDVLMFTHSPLFVQKVPVSQLHLGETDSTVF